MAQRAAYLRELGIDAWQPRAQPANPAPVADTSAVPAAAANSEPVVSEAVATPPVVAKTSQTLEQAPAVAAAEVVEPKIAPSSVLPPDVTPAVAPSTALQATAAAATFHIPSRDQLRGDLAIETLSQASVAWHNTPQSQTQLAVLGIDASGQKLCACGFDAEWAVLQKMLAAIGQNIDDCAIGGLQWGTAASHQLGTPYALLLVDSGDDAAALIADWQDKPLLIQGAQAVIAPHPRLFSQGTAIKRQAWTSLQMLQRLWAA